MATAPDTLDERIAEARATLKALLVERRGISREPRRAGPPPKALAPDVVSAAVAEYEAGANSATVARKAGVSWPTIRRSLVASGVAIRARHRPVGSLSGARFPERDAAVIEAFRAGETMEVIAKRFGVSRERIRQIVLRRANLSGVGRMVERRERLRETVRRLVDSGASSKDIADQIGRTQHCVATLRREAGVPNRNGMSADHPIKVAAAARRDAVVALYRLGLPPKEITKRLQLPFETTIYHYLQCAQEPVRDPRKGQRRRHSVTQEAGLGS